MSYKIKAVPGDFMVDEVLKTPALSRGKYAYFILEKKGIDTLSALKLISSKFRIPLRKISMAGIKDARAMTRQQISIESAGSLGEIETPQISLKSIGRGDEKIFPGMLLGNRFRILVRDLDSNSTALFEKRLKILKSCGYAFPDYFGDQRFQKDNAEIGRLLFQKRDKEAFDRWLPRLDGGAMEAWEQHHKKHPNEFIGIFLREKFQLRMFASSVQGLVFNNMASALVKKEEGSFGIESPNGTHYFPTKKIKQRDLPLVGFDSGLAGSVGKMAILALDKLSISQQMLIRRNLPELCLVGGHRLLLSKADDFECSIEGGQARLSFYLKKGSYATTLLRFLFEEQL